MSEQLSSSEPLITLFGQDVQAQVIDDFESYLVARGHAPRTQELYPQTAIGERCAYNDGDTSAWPQPATA